MSKKIKAKKIPLSLLDKTIYYVLMLLSILFTAFILLFFGSALPIKIAFSDSSVVAAKNSAAIGCSMPLILVFITSICAVSGYGLQIKQPIFGNKSFKPKGSKPMLKTFPLFSKEFRNSLAPQKRSTIKKVVLAVSIALLISSIIMLLGLFPRMTLDHQNNICTYNSFNQITHRNTVESAEKLMINIKYSNSTRGYNPSYLIELKFVFEDQTYRFTTGNFHEMSKEQTLEYMLYLKDFFKNGQYEITNIDRMNKLLDYGSFTAEETALIYRLFDYTK